MKIRRTKTPRIGETKAAMAILYSAEPPRPKHNAMPLSIQFTYAGEPVPAMRARVTRRGTFNPEKYTRYRRELSIALRAEFGHLIPEIPPVGSQARKMHLQTHRYHLTAAFYMGSNKAIDTDNLLKCLMDALQDSGLILNDSQIFKLTAAKHLGQESPRLELFLEAIQ